MNINLNENFDFIIELLGFIMLFSALDIIEVILNKSKNKFVRYFLLGCVTLFYIVSSIMLTYVGITFIKDKDSVPFGIFLIVLAVACIYIIYKSLIKKLITKEAK